VVFEIDARGEVINSDTSAMLFTSNNLDLLIDRQSTGRSLCESVR
jgi:hypothetical protein